MFTVILGIKILFAFIIALLITTYLVPLMIAVAHKLNILDVPNGTLKQHKAPTPYLGGVALYVGFITAIALTFPFANTMFILLVGCTLLLFVGLIDDLIVLKPYQKLFGQMVAAFCFLKGGFYLKATFLSAASSPLISLFWLFISFGWILSIINAFNLIDVMDGLATTTALCAAGSFFICALILDAPLVALLLAAFIGALVGFLLFNKPPAKIYLGDAGALFIGGFLAIVPFMISWGSSSAYGYLAPVAILAIPLLEEGTLILIRTWKKIPFYNGSPHHFSIFLRAKGWSPSKVLTFVTLFSLIIFPCSLLFTLGIISFCTFASLMFLLALWWFLTVLR